MPARNELYFIIRGPKFRVHNYERGLLKVEESGKLIISLMRFK